MFEQLKICQVYTNILLLFTHSVVPDSLRPHGLQHARLPCPSPTLGAYSNSCPLCQWSHPITSSSVVPFPSHLQSFPASESFQISQFFASGGQSTGVSASAISPSNEYSGLISFRIDWLDTKIYLNSHLVQIQKFFMCRKCRWGGWFSVKFFFFFKSLCAKIQSVVSSTHQIKMTGVGKVHWALSF